MWQVQTRGGEGIWPLWRKRGKGALTCLQGEWRNFWHFPAVAEKELLTLWLMLLNCLGEVCRRLLAYCTGLCISWIFSTEAFALPFPPQKVFSIKALYITCSWLWFDQITLRNLNDFYDDEMIFVFGWHCWGDILDFELLITLFMTCLNTSSEIIMSYFWVIWLNVFLNTT